MSKQTNQYQKSEQKIVYAPKGNVSPKPTLLDKFRKEAKEFRELMADFHEDCSVKYSATQVKSFLMEIQHYSSPDEGYGKKWMEGDYTGAMKDVRYAIDCLYFLADIASLETMQYLIPDLKAEENHQAFERFQTFIDTQVKDLEEIIHQIHLDWDSTKAKESPS